MYIVDLQTSNPINDGIAAATDVSLHFSPPNQATIAEAEQPSLATQDLVEIHVATIFKMESIFRSVRETYEAREQVREVIREQRNAAENVVREAQHALVSLHTEEDLSVALAKIRPLLALTGAAVAKVEAALPEEPGSFYRYSDIWYSQRQTIVMMGVLVQFVDGDVLADVDEVCKLAGAHVHLPLEDYLMGVCNAVSDLARLSMSRVIKTDYATAARCAVFGSNVFDALKELNFRNDFLRKRYDGVKYDVKRLEEIVYDISIRGLLVTPATRAGGERGTDGNSILGDDVAASDLAADTEDKVVKRESLMDQTE